ncbi:hypothetical protein APR41_17440 [Salegentibacter salinarum]|uniref:ASCH domain-containing protein n=1 Tax=Salegentibacter salinarum TaxID=447422 RepID=A0A2N0TW28_9FLAO|nr:ASCH domain-containing protein [Salegentibacter salinarum]PKD18906.1 hypothetical protein APR41_17440 [Salegentibacter salinarum]SKB88708.1 ASCH domain-containing protein [Salegentibacter salinarum]
MNNNLLKVGDQYIVTDWKGNVKTIIETMEVEKVLYKKITAEFAEMEGKADKSLNYWKKSTKLTTKEKWNLTEGFSMKYDYSLVILPIYLNNE